LSEAAAPTTPELAARALRIDLAIIVVMVVGILGLVGYSIALGPLTSPGVQSSFGYALALMFIMAGIAFHVIDRMYRVWPLGRRVHPVRPPQLTDASIAVALRVAIFVAACVAVAYVLGSLIVG
jgi:hypothetical protein